MQKIQEKVLKIPCQFGFIVSIESIVFLIFLAIKNKDKYNRADICEKNLKNILECTVYINKLGVLNFRIDL